VNGIELSLLGQRLVQVAQEALPPDSAMRRLPPATRLVLADVMRHSGTSTAEITERTGLTAGQAAALVADLVRDEFVRDGLDSDGRQRISVNPAPAFRDAPRSPVDGAIATALGSEDPAQVQEVIATLEVLARQLGVGPGLTSREGFDVAYTGTPPWETGRPQPAFVALAEAGEFRGKILDVGCGTGEHALLVAALGLTALGVDTSPRAISMARAKAADRGLPARFAVHDALDLPSLGEQFDTVIDSALFHVFSDEERTRYEASLREVIPPGGRYFMICFSEHHPGGFGPRRVTQDEIRATFAAGWRVDAIDLVVMDVVILPEGVQSWRAALTRL
jgi:SAM-dependent methyltransferase